MVLHATARAEYVVVKALIGNTGIVYVGNDAADDVTASNGFELSGGDTVLIAPPGERLSGVYVDSAENGDKVCWYATQPRGEDE